MNRLPTGWIRWLTVRVASNIDRLTRKPRLVSALGPPIAVAGVGDCHQRHDFALPLRMPSVGFAVLFGSGVGPGQIG